MTLNVKPQQGMDAHISRLRRRQKAEQRQQRIAALSGRMVNMRSGWLLVYVEDGSPVSFREAKMLADGMIEQL